MWKEALAAAALTALGYWVYWRWSNWRVLQLAALMPGPPTLPVIGNALVFMTKPEDLLNTLCKLLMAHGHYFRFWIGPQLNVCVRNPEDIRLLLTSGKINEKGPLYDFMRVLIGPGILTGGPTWRYHRKLLMQSYSRKAIQSYFAVFNTEAENFINVLLAKGATTCNIYLDVVKCTTQIVCQTLMGITKEDAMNVKRLDELVEISHGMYTFIFENMTHWWYQIPLMYRLSGRKKQEMYYAKLINEVMADILVKRKRVLKQPVDDDYNIIDRLLSGEMTEQELKWEMYSVFTASQDASGKIVAAVLLILAHYPEWQDKVYKEITDVLGPEDSIVTEDQLKRLTNLDLVYKEAIRYMPIAAFIQRRVEEEISIRNGTITLPKGASVIVPIHMVHRDPDYWEEPDKIKPERFLPENSKHRNGNAFIPFSLGAMDCLGRVYATGLVKTLVIKVLRRVQLEAVGAMEDLELNIAISVSFNKGYNLTARPRVKGF